MCKAILQLDQMPNSCGACPLSYQDGEKERCVWTTHEVGVRSFGYLKKRDDDCPLCVMVSIKDADCYAQMESCFKVTEEP